MNFDACQEFKGWVNSAVVSLGGSASTLPITETPNPPPMEKSERRKAYVSGVYFLMQGENVVYVGQSGNVYARLSQHMNHAPFEFDSFSITECAQGDRLAIEAKFIHDMQPMGNKIFPAYAGKPYEVRGAYFAEE